MPEEVLTEEEQIFCEGFLDPVIFFETFWSLPDEPWKAKPSQEDMLLDEADSISCKAGRGIGKTEEEQSKRLQICLLNSNKESLITTPRKAHIAPLMDRLFNKIKADEFLNSTLVQKISSPIYMYRFSNNHILHGRIAGASGGESVLSLHVDYATIDEGQLYLKKETEQLQGVFKPRCKIRIIGVPNGIRDSYLFMACHDETFSHHHYRKDKDPFWTEKEEQRLLKIYGGKNSQIWKNQVRGEFGLPAKKGFENWERSMISLPDYHVSSLSDERGKKAVEDLVKDLSLSEPRKKPEKVRISFDYGYSPDPSIAGIWLYYQEIPQLAGKVRMTSVAPSKQAGMLDWLARHFEAEIVSGDAGGAGLSILLDLKDDAKFSNKNYKVIPIMFGANIEIGEDGRTIKDKSERTNQKTWKFAIKEFSSMQLQDKFNKKLIRLPNDDYDLEKEIDECTRIVTDKGAVKYVGVDHHLDMIRCLIMCDYLEPQDGGESMAPIIGFAEI